MFEENNTLATEEVDENVEQATEELVDGVKEVETTEQSDVGVATEEQPKMYTEAELEEIKTTIKLNAKKNAERKIRREYDRKYGRLENVLKAGTGENDLDKVTDTFTDFYTNRGIDIPKTPVLSQKQAEYLAEREANEIIESGYDEIEEELNRLSDVGFDNMTASDKHMFSILSEEAKRIINEKELKSIGVTELPADFKDFSDKLNPNLSMKEKYDMYTKLNPKKKVEPIGSMKSGQVNKVKDYYSEDEISRLTLDDLNDPNVWEAVRKSMTGQN